MTKVASGCCVVVLLAFLTRLSATQGPDATAHAIQLVTVEPDVKLEVVDWGGPASPSPTLILLAGLGDTAHRFDPFAPQLTSRYRVFGVTRRGFGASSAPVTGYGADRLGDDVLAVLEALKVQKPILVGHSLGGEELSSIGSRYPERVSGLIYLDAGYGYAFMAPGAEPMPPPSPDEKIPPVIRAIVTGVKKYTTIPVPILAIYAVPRRMPASVSAEDRAQTAELDKATAAQANAFEKGVPTARVVRIPNAGHYVHRTNEADVLREMDAFIAGLKFKE
jgi:pimeloyl-ACP methyl ester carboxylesterase